LEEPFGPEGELAGEVITGMADEVVPEELDEAFQL